MLRPAIEYKDKLLELFSKEIYSDRYFWYAGYAHGHKLPTISDEDNIYQWAILSDVFTVEGYLAYSVYPEIDSVENFGLYSFDDDDNFIIRRALSVGKDVHEKLEELVEAHHRVSWRMISGNPVMSSYDAFCRKHHGNKVCLHDICKDVYGEYHDEYIYEIIKPVIPTKISKPQFVYVTTTPDTRKKEEENETNE